MNADGSDPTNLSNHPADDFRPQWSPDGSKIVFQSERTGDSDIYTMNADGSEKTNLTNTRGYDHSASWSHDGSKITFTSQRDRNWEVYVMNADGSRQTRLTQGGGNDRYSSWSPDDQFIVFQTNRDRNFEIYVMNADGSNPVRLTHHPGDDTGPSWCWLAEDIPQPENRTGLAREFFERGRYHESRDANREDALQAVEMFEKAVETDAAFAEGWAALSRAYMWLSWYHGGGARARSAAEGALDRAVQLAPESAATHLAQGDFLYWGSRDYEQALEHYSTAEEMQPENPDAPSRIGAIRRRQGRWAEAVARWERAVELVPDDRAKVEDLGLTYFWMREYAEAKRCLDRTIDLAPDLPHYWQWDVYLFLNWDGTTERSRQALEEGKGRLTPLQFALLSAELDKIDGQYEKALATLDPYSGSHEAQLEKASIHVLLDQPSLAIRQYDLARAILERGPEVGISNRVRLSRLGVAYAGLGLRQEAVDVGETAVGLLPVSRDALSGTLQVPRLAEIYMMVGEYDAAIDILEELLSIPSNISVERLRIDPTWNPLRGHPRFQALLEEYRDDGVPRRR